MPRKTKEINAEKNVKKQSTLDNKVKVAKKVTSSKPKATKKVATKVVKKADKPVKATTKSKVVSKTVKEKEAKTKPTTKAKAKEAKATKTKSTANAKAKETKAKSTTKAKAKETKAKPTAKAKVKKVAKVSKAKSKKVSAPENVEYYDLPYKYNQTVVKMLYQNPTTLFVYWEISDEDVENYKKTYGDNFFEVTKPVLVVYNTTMNYHFEIDINDFANSWYFNIKDSKCDYRIELIRKPISSNEKIKANRIFISSSNGIESPNDKILFSTDEPYTVYFRNTKNNHQRKVDLRKLLDALNLTNKKFGFPLIRNIYDLYKFIYHVDDIQEFSIDLNNPSSGNPSSGTFSLKFH